MTRPDAPREQNQLAVERIGSTVVFTLRLADHYKAMALYDEACGSLNKTGTVSLSIDGAVRATPPKDGEDAN